jgi:hypothetical protein
LRHYGRIKIERLFSFKQGYSSNIIILRWQDPICKTSTIVNVFYHEKSIQIVYGTPVLPKVSVRACNNARKIIPQTTKKQTTTKQQQELKERTNKNVYEKFQEHIRLENFTH